MWGVNWLAVAVLVSISKVTRLWAQLNPGQSTLYAQKWSLLYLKLPEQYLLPCVCCLLIYVSIGLILQSMHLAHWMHHCPLLSIFVPYHVPSLHCILV